MLDTETHIKYINGSIHYLELLRAGIIEGEIRDKIKRGKHEKTNYFINFSVFGFRVCISLPKRQGPETKDEKYKDKSGGH